MRDFIKFNDGWLFSKSAESIPSTLPTDWEQINLPHTWNATDGQDGGNDYHRGTCYYAKAISKADLPQADLIYLEIRGANSSADVYLNGKKIKSHDGGYSTWHADMTDNLSDTNLLVIAVDNSPNDRVYPQMADFTFYGGLYRDVNIIGVSESHFEFTWGSNGLLVTPKVDGSNATVEIKVQLENQTDKQSLVYTVNDAEGNTVASITVSSSETKAELNIDNVHLWNGRKDPYLYTAKVELIEGDTVLDEVSARFGCRTFKVDPEKGFFLNGESYPLRGVSRHQDRLGIGNALLPEHHEEDIELICEVGANTIRLAHYQHDQYFYDLCDEKGLVIWAEIPYISKHLPNGRENTISQMHELVFQNYNHASIFFWGLSNEITMGGAEDSDLIENHRILNDLVHDIDRTRLTTMAVVSMCDIHASYIKIPDLVSYNHYFGWYGGDTSMNGPWFDKFHKEFPNIPIGMSEYGCEALNWHNSNPAQGDYSEEYQAYYHEELIKQLFSRPYIWATHVWNMFDFGADARSEGGENGQNHKGLITFDRKYKKDSFYAYKAWLSDEPFVHICGKRYIDRVEDTTKVTVYSNQPEVELFANGKSLGKKSAADHFFYFDVPNAGETNLTAVAGEYKDESIIRKVGKFNEDYLLREKGAVLNWFDVTEPEGRLSINSTISEVMKTFRGKFVLLSVGKMIMKQMKSSSKSKENSGGFSAAGFKITPDLMKMLGGFTLLRASNMAGMINLSFTKEQLLAVNAKLNKIKKPKNK